MYGSKMTAQMVLDHTYFWLHYVPTIVTSGITSVSLLVHFPVNVNKDAAFNELKSKLGDSYDTATFDSDEGIYLVYPMNQKS